MGNSITQPASKPPVYMGIEIDYGRDSLLTEMGKKTWEQRYKHGDEKSPQESLARVAVAFGNKDLAFSQRIYNYVSKQWFMYSTPVYANGGTDKAMPISCFLNYVPDSTEGITSHYTETAMLSVNGGGVGSYWGHIRSSGSSTSRGAKTSGLIPFLHVTDSLSLSFNQGSSRNASIAPYLDISHPEVVEFINMRKPTGGDANRKCLNLHHGVNIPDKFMNIIESCKKDPKANDDWDLIDPHSGKVIETVSAKGLWEQILETRLVTGEPYIHYIDRSNEHLPQTQKDKGLKIVQSNLCSEILLPTGYDNDGDLRTAVCCLSSINLDTYDDWKHDVSFANDLVRFLDNVLEYFINNAPEQLKHAVASASKERAIGIGTMGFCSYLQRKGIPVTSPMAVGINENIYKSIKEQLVVGSKILAAERGEPSDMTGTGMRNSHLMAIAPNATSSVLCGNVSPSIEPMASNAYIHQTLSGSFLVKNNNLTPVLEKYGRNDDATWDDITTRSGSVQHLDFMNDWDKSVFLTAREIPQEALVELAGRRQKYICQGQSLNIFLNAGEKIKRISDLHVKAWKVGLKTLYYLRSSAAKKASMSRVTNDIKPQKSDSSDGDCFFCEG